MQRTPLYAGFFLGCHETRSRLKAVIPAKAEIHRQYEAWIPAFAGMTSRSETALMRDFRALL
jgi:hypothetical protein